MKLVNLIKIFPFQTARSYKVIQQKGEVKQVTINDNLVIIHFSSGDRLPTNLVGMIELGERLERAIWSFHNFNDSEMDIVRFMNKKFRSQTLKNFIHIISWNNLMRNSLVERQNLTKKITSARISEKNLENLGFNCVELDDDYFHQFKKNDWEIRGYRQDCDSDLELKVKHSKNNLSINFKDAFALESFIKSI